MSQEEFESYLRLMSRFLRLTEQQRESIRGELRDHMEERLAELMARGYSRSEAIEAALDEFGDAAVLTADFNTISRRRKWIMRTTTGTIGIAATILLVSFLLPENRPGIPAPQAIHAQQVALPMSEEAVSPAGQETKKWIFAQKESPSDRKARQSLNSIMKMVEFREGQTFGEILDWIRETGELNVVPNVHILEEWDITRDTELTSDIRLQEVTLEMVLKIVLDSISQIEPEGRLGYVVENGVLRISTCADLDRYMVVRVYDCRDLIGRENSSGLFVDLITNQVLPGTWLQDRHDTSPPRGRYSARPATQPAAEIPRGSISDYDGLIVIRHTLNAHEGVVELLDMLREAYAARETTTQPAETGMAFTPLKAR